LIVILFLAAIPACKRQPDSGRKAEMVMNERLRAKVQTLDPADVGDTTSDGVCREFYESLYAYHYLKRPYQIILELAAAMPQISDDGTIYRIPVKQGVYFHDDPCFPDGKGRELTARDFVFSFKRTANVKTRSKSWYIFDGRIIGLDDFREYTKGCEGGKVDYDRPVEGVYAEDDFTLVIKLHRPWPQLIYWLAYLPTAPMAKEAVDYYGPDIVKHPVGTGPYILKKWYRGIYLEAVRNPNYRPVYYPPEGMPEDVAAGLLDDAGKRLPFIDRVFWRVVVEDQPRWLLLMRGDIDLITIPKDNFGQAVSAGQELTEDMKQRGMKLETFDEPSTFWLGMNMNDPILGANQPLRYAISYAIDRKRYIDLFWNGRGHPAYGLIPPIMKEYDPSINETSLSVYDPDKARASLAEAERVYGRSIPRLRLAMGGIDNFYRQSAQFFKRCLNDVGLDVEIELYDWPTFLEKLRAGSLQLNFSGWMADYPDAESFLSCFYSQNAPWPNSSNYHNPEFDALYERVSVMPDSPERSELYRQAQQIVIEDMPCAFTYHRIGYIIRHGWLENLKPDGYKSDTYGSGYLKYYKVNSKKRDEYRKKFK
jgi:oligopeptide transport system substrate-binding protein